MSHGAVIYLYVELKKAGLCFDTVTDDDDYDDVDACIRYSHYAVSLAYHVIAMWFIKCRQPFKRGFVQYIVKVCFIVVPLYVCITAR